MIVRLGYASHESCVSCLQAPDVIDFSKNESSVHPLDPQPPCADPHVAASIANGAWTCLDFLGILVAASERTEELPRLALRIVEPAVVAVPDAVLLGFGMLASAHARRLSQRLPRHVLSVLAPKVVSGKTPASWQVLQRLCQRGFTSFQLVLQAAHASEPQLVSTIFKIVQVWPCSHRPARDVHDVSSQAHCRQTIRSTKLRPEAQVSISGWFVLLIVCLQWNRSFGDPVYLQPLLSCSEVHEE